MSEYCTNQVEKLLTMYAEMVYQSKFKKGAISIAHRDTIENTIQRAKTKFPEELKGEQFKYFLRKLEGILEKSEYLRV